MHKLSALALTLLVGQGAFAQTSASDTSTYQQAVQAAVASYHQAMGNAADLYNGVEHVRYLPYIDGIPYYQADEWKKGTVVYNGIEYRNVDLKYDLVKDLVIVAHPDGYSSFSLYSPRVSTFSLGESTFIYIRSGGDPTTPAPGFYQVLLQGPLTVLARHSKRIEEQALAGKVEWKFTAYDRYYILKDGKYYSLRNEGTLLAFAGQRRKEAKQALKNQQIRFKKAPEQAILTVVQYSNQ